MKELLQGSIAALADLYRKKQVSPVELTRFLFDQIEIEEPKINAFISLYKNEALEEAKRAEKQLIAGENPHPLCGIPYSLKDLYYIQDKATTCGSTILKDFRPSYHAAVYEKFQQTGAV